MAHEHARTRDGRELHFERHGEGSPTVVFESGLGASRNMWGAVAPAVAARTTTVAYDRSGLGRSAPDSATRDLARQVDDLLDLLTHLGDGPFVLVGHSWGGPIVRCATERRPDLVAGLVLVDQTDEGCELFFSRTNERRARQMRWMVPLLSRTGLLQLGVRHLAKQLPEPAASAMRAEDATPAALRAQVAEIEPNAEDLRWLRARSPKVPDVPVTLISGGAESRLERGRRAGLVAAHRQRADALTGGRHVVAPRSGHHVPLTEPELVADEVLRVVDAVRAYEPS